MFILKVLATVLVGSFIVWGYWHEDKFVQFEDRLIEKLKEKLR